MEQRMFHPNPGKVFMIFGVLAIVYGIINYLMISMSWPAYSSWIVGGIILLLVSWAKQSKS